MSRQLELDMPGAMGARGKGAKKRLSRATRGGFATFLSWAPVWGSFLFLGQLTWFGLRPAWEEKERLDAAEMEVRAREEKLRSEYQALEEDQQKLTDEIYRERVRKSLSDPELPPLLLEGSRSGEK